MERAFLDTYGIPLSDVIKDEDLAIGTFRRAISTIIPEMTRVALLARRKELVAETPNFNARKFRYYLSRAEYRHEWGKGYRKPGIGTRILAFFLKFVPKVGPFKALDFKIPTRRTEDLYIASVNRTVEDYKHLVAEEGKKDLHLTNTDFDTGRVTHAGEYDLSDKTYAKLLDGLAQHNFEHVTPDLRDNILAFYGGPNASVPTETKTKKKKNLKDLAKTQDELQRLKALSIPPKPAADKSNLNEPPEMGIDPADTDSAETDQAETAIPDPSNPSLSNPPRSNSSALVEQSPSPPVELTTSR
jgi:hypothetical protein